MNTIEIYKNYGCLAAEKRAVYTYGNQAETATCSDVLTIRIPDGWTTYEGASGETLLTAPWGKNYTVHNVLDGEDYPLFRTFGHGQWIQLEVIAKGGQEHD